MKKLPRQILPGFALLIMFFSILIGCAVNRPTKTYYEDLIKVVYTFELDIKRANYDHHGLNSSTVSEIDSFLNNYSKYKYSGTYFNLKILRQMAGGDINLGGVDTSGHENAAYIGALDGFWAVTYDEIKKNKVNLDVNSIKANVKASMSN